MKRRVPIRFTRLAEGLFGLLAILFLVLAWSGCGSPEDRYKVMSFFFDGVPKPGAGSADGAGRSARSPGAPADRLYKHQPYEQGACRECHTSPSNIYASALDSQVCMKCHEPVTRQYPRMHGPVAAVACLYCHSAHDAEYEYLLKTDEPEMCTQCHQRGVLLGDDPPAHLDPERSCIDCHSGHGGTGSGFLLPRDQWEEPEEPEAPADSEAPAEPDGPNASPEGETESRDGGAPG